MVSTHSSYSPAVFTGREHVYVYVCTRLFTMLAIVVAVVVVVVVVVAAAAAVVVKQLAHT